jgi:predicted nucleic-acid-binding Zn-ribbon protein
MIKTRVFKGKDAVCVQILDNARPLYDSNPSVVDGVQLGDVDFMIPGRKRSGKELLTDALTAIDKKEPRAHLPQNPADAAVMRDAIKHELELIAALKPVICVECGGRELSKVDVDLSNCSPGKIAEYKAGNWGTVRCDRCGYEHSYNY